MKGVHMAALFFRSLGNHRPIQSDVAHHYATREDRIDTKLVRLRRVDQIDTKLWDWRHQIEEELRVRLVEAGT